ncbi:hypothetical protein [Psychrobacillus phage Perkons]|nr:hypothetical protein [Psychrobacillus phage Perkons]
MTKDIKVKTHNHIGEVEYETLYSYCSKLSKRNNSILYLLEKYLNKKLLDESELTKIRDIVLTVSADISKLNTNLLVGDEDEELQ